MTDDPTTSIPHVVHTFGSANSGSISVTFIDSEQKAHRLDFDPASFERLETFLREFAVFGEGENRHVKLRDAEENWDHPRSALIEHWEYVWSIGMVTVEMANLDVFMADLLAALVRTSEDNGAILYLTPRSAFGRIAILENIAPEVLKPNSTSLRTVESLIGRARSLVDKRHGIIHDAWGVKEGVLRLKLPGSAMRPVPIEELRLVIRDIRRLMYDVQEAVPALRKAEQDYKLPDENPEQSPEASAPTD